MTDLVKTFDVDWVAGMSFGLFQVRKADVATLVGELEAIFKGPESPIGGLLRFMPVRRLNAVLAVSAQPLYLDQVGEWIDRLDKDPGRVRRTFHKYEIKFGDATELASVITALFSSGHVDAFSPSGGPVLPATTVAGAPIEGRANNSYDGGAPQAVVGSLDLGGIKVVANQKMNSLYISATIDEYASIEDVLEELDVVPVQVMIEATIAEVTLTDELRFGLQAFLNVGDSQFTFSEVSSGVIASQFPGFSYLLSGPSRVRTVLNALASITDVNVISTPRVIVLSNQTATLQVGDQIPVITQSAVSVTDPNAPIVSTVQYRDTGVILKVTPKIAGGDVVQLEISQEVSDVIPTKSSGIDSPTIQERRITTTIAVADGETVALGGLIRESRSRSRNGIPILHDLPIIGNLFGGTKRSQSKTELVVFATPRIIRNRHDAQNVTDELRELMKSISPRRY